MNFYDILLEEANHKKIEVFLLGREELNMFNGMRVFEAEPKDLRVKLYLTRKAFGGSYEERSRFITVDFDKPSKLIFYWSLPNLEKDIEAFLCKLDRKGKIDRLLKKTL